MQGSRQDKVKFQDQLVTKFQHNFTTFFNRKQLNTHRILLARLQHIKSHFQKILAKWVKFLTISNLWTLLKFQEFQDSWDLSKCTQIKGQTDRQTDRQLQITIPLTSLSSK